MDIWIDTKIEVTVASTRGVVRLSCYSWGHNDRNWGINAQDKLQISKCCKGEFPKLSQTALVTAWFHVSCCPLFNGVRWPDCFSSRVLGNTCSNHCDVTARLATLNSSHTLHGGMQRNIHYYSWERNQEKLFFDKMIFGKLKLFTMFTMVKLVNCKHTNVIIDIYDHYIYVHVCFLQHFKSSLVLNSLRPRLNRRPFADDIFKCIFLNENEWILPRISLKFVPKVQINKIPALVQIMAWCRPGDKPLSEPMMVNLLTHICVTRPQWVNNGIFQMKSCIWQGNMQKIY